MAEYKTAIIAWDLEDIELNELIMVIGSFIFSGHNINEVETEVIDKMKELIELESRKDKLESDLKILLLPRDPNDDKNLILEINGYIRRRHNTLRITYGI